MLAKAPTVSTRFTPVTATVDDEATSWYSTSVVGLLPGMTLVPFTEETVCIADSHKLAVATWRYTNSFLGYYRVIPDGELRGVDSVPGLYRCESATIIEAVDNGARWSDEELWPLVRKTRWADGRFIYDATGHITEPPGLPNTRTARTLVDELKQERYLLPTLAAKDLAALRGEWSGPGWRAYAA
jgi:hypothetical protein